MLAQSPDNQLFEDSNWETPCKTTLAAPLPPEAAALQERAAHGQSTARPCCDENHLYYGFGRAPAYQQALLCAYLHRTESNHPFLTGSGTLAMLYANGDAVPQDYSLAIRFACEADREGGQNTEQRVGRLEAPRDGKLPARTRFDVCDEQMSGAMDAYCEELQQSFADVGRARKLEALAARMPEKAREQLSALEAAERAFEKARSAGEDTGGGSGSAGFEALDQGRLREQLVINLHRFAAGDLPAASAADRARAEQQLKEASATAEKAAEPPDRLNGDLGAPDPDKAGLALTQRAWEALFAAWMRFIPLGSPSLSSDRAATELLRLRIHQLKGVVT